MEPMVKTTELIKMMSTSQTTMATILLLTMQKLRWQPLKTQQAARSKPNLWPLQPWMMSQCPRARVLLPQNTKKNLLQRPIRRLGPPTTMLTQQQKTLNKNKLNKIIKLRIEFKFERVSVGL